MINGFLSVVKVIFTKITSNTPEVLDRKIGIDEPAV